MTRFDRMSSNGTNCNCMNFVFHYSIIRICYMVAISFEFSKASFSDMPVY